MQQQSSNGGAPEAAPVEGDLLYGVPEIARFLGIKVSQAKHRVASGLIPSFRIGESICAKRSTLTRWLAELEARAAGDEGARS